ncbi:MAG: hypothetical protein KF884_08565 [Fimbriimonadaceae bacterium]|nr:hypothetical protein [Fimbriimonadaceae bacterium]QYK57602.1 MAG: hypothetical protein KF884_08565 [Fimbriimonadaceae bacterium]
MSDRVDPSQYTKRLADYLAAYTPADNWQRSDFRKRLLEELTRLAYLRVAKADVMEGLDPMIQIHSSFMLSKRVTEMVQVDLGTVWSSVTAQSERASHTFRDTEVGFEGRYLCVTAGVFVTVVMRVIATR